MKVGRRNLEISHADKIMFPQQGYTKEEVVEYYHKISPVLLRHIRDRAVTLQRYPEGIDSDGFVQQEAAEYFDTAVGRASLTHKNGKVIDHVICTKSACLVYLANQGVISLHCWLSRVDMPNSPDRMIFDLDPTESGFDQVQEAGAHLRELLEELGLKSFVMTTGSKGAHVAVPLQRKGDFERVRKFAADIAVVLSSRYPKRLTMEQRRDKRGRKVYIDVMRNGYGQTGVAPYSLRSVAEAAVATPLDWREFFNLSDARKYTLKNIFHRLAGKEDPWRGMGRHSVSLKGPRANLNKML